VDPTLFLLLIVVALVVLAGLAIAGRRRREAALEPTRLGPSWTPATGDEDDTPETQREDLDRQIGAVSERTGLDRASVEVVLSVWHEYLAVLGITRLPATHRYRIYDPYNPPVARRDAEGRPTPDRERVARDVGNRTEVTERDAEVILAATTSAQGSDATS
jgi:hypothetical protein